jgi:hypothetical protein
MIAIDNVGHFMAVLSPTSVRKIAIHITKVFYLILHPVTTCLFISHQCKKFSSLLHLIKASSDIVVISGKRIGVFL